MARLRVRPRDYQVEAAEWALRRGRAVVCMPTGTGKTLVAVLWIVGLMERGLARRFLVLEPTRFLVEQVASYMRSVAGLDARPLHGSMPRGLREKAWPAPVVVATPEIIVAEWDVFLRQGFDAVVVDECHHTTGKDAYKKVMKGYEFRYRLGLTAHIPRGRRREIEETIGPVREWSWEDPRLAPYIPPWSAEVYEAPFNEAEKRLYEELEKRAWRSHGRDRMLYSMAARWLARDGALGLRESLARETRLAKLLQELRDMIEDERVRPAHKLPALLRALEDHEPFQKTIVFIDRVVVARHVAEKTAKYKPVLIVGRRSRPEEVRETLQKAHSPETRLIVSTSAGEEGIDLPEADILAVWSHTASPTRFIQRHGRILRATGARRHKKVIYIVTPDTVDVDSLLDSLIEARRAGVHVNIDPETIKNLMELSRRRRILDIIAEHPMDEQLLHQATGMPQDRLRQMLRWLLRHGLAVYIYTPIGKVYTARETIDKLYTQYPESLTPDTTIKATITPKAAGRKQRSIKTTYSKALERLRNILRKYGEIEAIHATLQVPVSKALLRQVNLTYNYPIEDEKILKLVLDNIYAAKNYTTHQ